MPSAFEELCEQRNVLPSEWKKSLAMPIIPDKCLLDMTDTELEEHYGRVEERAENTKEDRALVVLERTQEGRLERQAVKVFCQCAQNDTICADQVPDMLEALRYELTNTEVHFLLRKFDATEDFDMIPEAELNKKQWLWLVGECQMLKETYQHLNPEAFEVCYESMIQNLAREKDTEEEDRDAEDWPNIPASTEGWLFGCGCQSEYMVPLQPYVWGMQPDVEEELLRQMEKLEEDGAESLEAPKPIGELPAPLDWTPTTQKKKLPGGRSEE